LAFQLFKGGLQPRDKICKWSSSLKRFRTADVNDEFSQNCSGWIVIGGRFTMIAMIMVVMLMTGSR